MAMHRIDSVPDVAEMPLIVLATANFPRQRSANTAALPLYSHHEEALEDSVPDVVAMPLVVLVTGNPLKQGSVKCVGRPM